MQPISISCANGKKKETQKARDVFANYEASNPLAYDSSELIDRQNALIALLEDKLQDAEHRESLLQFKLSMAAQGVRRPQPQWHGYAPEPEILPPSRPPRRAGNGRFADDA